MEFLRRRRSERDGKGGGSGREEPTLVVVESLLEYVTKS